MARAAQRVGGAMGDIFSGPQACERPLKHHIETEKNIISLRCMLGERLGPQH